MYDDYPSGRLFLYGLFCSVLALLFLYLTWPVGIFLPITGSLWLFSKGSSRLWAQAIAYVFSAVTIGLAILCLALLVLNFFKTTFDPKWVRSSEEFLYVTLLYLRRVNSSKLATVSILIILTVATYYLPNWKLLDKFLFLKKSVSKTIIVLATITSFTFFGQIATNNWAVDAQKKVVQRYRAALREEWKFQGQYLSAQALERHVRELDAPRIHYYRTVYSTIRSEARRHGTDYTSVVSEHMANLQSTKTNEVLNRLINNTGNNPSTKVKLPEEELIERLPASVGERNKQLELLADQELRTKAAETQAIEALKGLKKAFAEVVTSQLPGVEGIAGFYLKKLVSNYSELFFEKTVEQSHRMAVQLGTNASVLTAEIIEAAQVTKQLLEPRLPSGATEVSVVGLAAVSPLMRAQAEQEVQRVTKLEVDQVISKEVSKRPSAEAFRTSTGHSSGSSSLSGSRRPSSRPPPARPRRR